ncbi:fumarate reductase flavoprotein subunit [Cetobacterium ceti]|uniref:Fumarate reductase flavoprotein subunit n=1 Tax=Cetobacterium ceti TaxID=180163 RepID=A0A1T4PF53_9FUSO|nr:FAD-binding protein [Cetobacterium ceti]SJZ89967.1 fumarate reductase flavoprotein subunit [Cetobacterium ceti]
MNKSGKLLMLGLIVGALGQNILANEKMYVVKEKGFSGEIKLEVISDDDKIKDIKLVSHNETSHIMSRAFPILKERILKANSPIVDSVSGATYTSTAIKRGVNEVYKKMGKKYGRITPRTKAPEQPIAYLETVKTDLVIVGGGPAGLAAAIAAKESGIKNVILIEKLDILSGNGKYDMNFYDLINSDAQKKAGVEDSIEKFVKDNSNSMDTPERTMAQAKGAWVLDKWLRNMGIELNHYYGKRGHMAEKDAYGGEEVQDGLEKRAKELGIDIRTSTKGLDFIMENGKVSGVKVQNKNNFYDIKSTGVVITTGGFSSNKELLKKYVPGSENFQTSNQIGATGDFLPIFEKYNMEVKNLDVLNIFPFIISHTRDLTGGGDGFILVNKMGKRFMSESISKDKRVEAANKMLEQPDSQVFYIYDQNLYESSYRLQKHTAKGYHVKADTLEELGEKLGINSEILEETILTYNKGVKGKIKDPYTEKPFKREFKLEGPFYGVQVESAVHMTRGGVVANEKTEVLYEDGKIVPGLFAAGEVTNSSAAYSAAVIFGRIAGENAAKYINNK